MILSLSRSLVILTVVSACAAPPPEVTVRPLSFGMIKIEAAGFRNTSTRLIREGLLLHAAQATLDKGATYFVIADEVHGTRQVRKGANKDFGIAPSYTILETSTRERMDLAPDAENYETVPQPFGAITIELFDLRPLDDPRPVYEAETVLSLAQPD